MNPLQIEVVCAEGHKCPRCWKYNGIPSNHQGICDTCARAILESTADDYMDNRRPEQSEDDFRVGFALLQEAIRTAYRNQLAVFHAGS